ncbi:hypothetical protein Tco_1250836 [Tanacetum coccineum]
MAGGVTPSPATKLVVHTVNFKGLALWEIIRDGNSFKPVAQTTTNADGTSTSTIPGVVTTEEKIQKKNDLKARTDLMVNECHKEDSKDTPKADV